MKTVPDTPDGVRDYLAGIEANAPGTPAGTDRRSLLFLIGPPTTEPGRVPAIRREAGGRLLEGRVAGPQKGAVRRR
jgi:hypothetical protein